MANTKASLIIDKDYAIGTTDPRLYSSFIEHVGRAVYGGIYQPGHPQSDGDGFRKDVLALVRELDVSTIRYPGGNFLSGYRWEDGIGDPAKRPRRMDLAWRSTETNQVGVDEFCKWAKLAGADVMMAVNLGTRGVQDACNLLEYCNLPGGTKYSDMRVAGGNKEAHGIRLWCLGNEMDGPWQIGQKTAYEYGRLARQTAHAMKAMDESIELVSCGSSYSTMPTFPAWEAETLEHTYAYADYISLHQYFGNSAGDTADYLASTLEMDRYIETVVSVCDYSKAKQRSRKTMMLSFDEWNVWFHSKAQEERIMAEQPWQVAPRLLEDIYTLEDALMVGGMLISLISHGDRVKIACFAQLVNAIAPIIAEDSGVYRQSTFYPFLHASRYGRGRIIRPVVTCNKYDSANFTDVPVLSSVAVFSQAENALTLFVLNRDLQNDQVLECELRGFSGMRLREHLSMSGELNAVNTLETSPASPQSLTGGQLRDNRLVIKLSKASWNVIRLAGEQV